MKYRPERDLSHFALEHKTLSPSKIREIILIKKNRAVTPESITMWFKRHSLIYEKLKKSILMAQKDLEEVDPSIFKNGTFEKLESVQNWIKDLTLRKAKPKSISICLCCALNRCARES